MWQFVKESFAASSEILNQGFRISRLNSHFDNKEFSSEKESPYSINSKEHFNTSFLKINLTFNNFNKHINKFQNQEKYSGFPAQLQ